MDPMDIARRIQTGTDGKVQNTINKYHAPLNHIMSTFAADVAEANYKLNDCLATLRRCTYRLPEFLALASRVEQEIDASLNEGSKTLDGLCNINMADKDACTALKVNSSAKVEPWIRSKSISDHPQCPPAWSYVEKFRDVEEMIRRTSLRSSVGSQSEMCPTAEAEVRVVSPPARDDIQVMEPRMEVRPSIEGSQISAQLAQSATQTHQLTMQVQQPATQPSSHSHPQRHGSGSLARGAQRTSHTQVGAQVPPPDDSDDTDVEMSSERDGVVSRGRQEDSTASVTSSTRQREPSPQNRKMKPLEKINLDEIKDPKEYKKKMNTLAGRRCRERKRLERENLRAQNARLLAELERSRGRDGDSDGNDRGPSH